MVKVLDGQFLPIINEFDSTAATARFIEVGVAAANMGLRHEEGADEGHEEESHSLFWPATFPVILVMLLLTSLAIYLPIYLKNSRKYVRGLASLNAFATGAFIGLAIFHLLPEALEAAEASKLGFSINHSWYNLTFPLLFIGFVIVVFSEKLIPLAVGSATPAACGHAIDKAIDYVQSEEKAESPLEKDGGPFQKASAAERALGGAAGAAEVSLEKKARHANSGVSAVSGASSATAGCGSEHHPSTAHCGGHNHSADCCVPHSHVPSSTCQGHSHQPFHTAVGAARGDGAAADIGTVGADGAPRNGGLVAGDGTGARLTVGAAVACLAISVHSLFEGIVVGVMDDVLTIWVAAGAILFHKVAVAIAVSINMLNAELSTGFRNFFLAVFIFSTPVGIVVGAILSSMGAEAAAAIAAALGVGAVLAAGCEMLFLHFGASHNFKTEAARFVWFIVGAVGVFACMMAHLYAHQHHHVH